jgi:hypothetical protein
MLLRRDDLQHGSAARNDAGGDDRTAWHQAAGIVELTNTAAAKAAAARRQWPFPEIELKLNLLEQLIE